MATERTPPAPTPSFGLRAAALARRVLPRRLRYFLQRYVSATDLKLRAREAADPLATVTNGGEDAAPGTPRLGIVRNAAQYHTSFVRACQELRVPFVVIDLAADDWLVRIRDADCRGLLVWPDGMLTIWNEMLLDRVTVAAQELGLPVFPSLAELRLFENKRRMTYWLEANEIPHPRTWIFYSKDHGLDHAARCPLPVVFKASFGAAGSGVRIIEDRRQLQRSIDMVFRRGFVPDGLDRRDRQWGVILLQEFLSDVKEWRLVRIGESYFGHPKGRVGTSMHDLHSGSGAVEWDPPEAKHLDFLKSVTDRGEFRSMAVDTFETPDGRLLVNELQTVFGAAHSVDQARVDGQAGRFVPGPEGWTFEPGDFARNACANERVRYFLGSIQPHGGHP